MIIDQVMSELDSAIAKFPAWPSDPIHAAAIVSEEAGELIRASVQYGYEDGTVEAMVTEALHTAATAIRFVMGVTGGVS